jgi:hypothetical protein
MAASTVNIITAEVWDTNSTTVALTGDKNKLIKYHSIAKAVMVAESSSGTIDNDQYVITNGDKKEYSKICKRYKKSASS